MSLTTRENSRIRNTDPPYWQKTPARSDARSLRQSSLPYDKRVRTTRTCANSRRPVRQEVRKRAPQIDGRCEESPQGADFPGSRAAYGDQLGWGPLTPARCGITHRRCEVDIFYICRWALTGAD